jgi:hypothetical protein
MWLPLHCMVKRKKICIKWTIPLGHMMLITFFWLVFVCILLFCVCFLLNNIALLLLIIVLHCYHHLSLLNTTSLLCCYLSSPMLLVISLDIFYHLIASTCTNIAFADCFVVVCTQFVLHLTSLLLWWWYFPPCLQRASCL